MANELYIKTEEYPELDSNTITDAGLYWGLSITNQWWCPKCGKYHFCSDGCPHEHNEVWAYCPHCGKTLE